MKKWFALLLTGVMSFSMVACGTTSSIESVVDTEEEDTETISAETTSSVDNSYAEDTDALIEEYADAFEQIEYTDEETGLTITYNLYLPEGYDESESYPMVVFIADSSCVGDDATTSLTQGRGALVWAAEEWQSANPSIVLVPTYPETILDDQSDYYTSDYVELTKRLIDTVSEEYAVDTDRIYGTGQSMGCMTTLILASEYPDLYAACMFVDGQWDVSTLSALEGQTFVYFAAEDDTSAYNGMQEVMEMFDEDGVSYSYAQWDGTWTPDELSEATSELFTGETNAYFISWASGTIEAADMSMSMGGGGNGGHGDMASEDADVEDLDSTEAVSDTEVSEDMAQGMKGGGQMSSSDDSEDGDSIMSSVQYHMASFDYAYRSIAVMEWLFEQTK